MRLMVIDPPGSGKTTLCHSLAAEQGLNSSSHDALFFEEDWKERPTEPLLPRIPTSFIWHTPHHWPRTLDLAP